ncbi:MAG: S41 family peptidase [Bryobacteraceae bacterium]
MSTVAGPAIAAYPTLNVMQRESLIDRVSKAVEERIWDPAFKRDRWREAVERCREDLVRDINMAEFEQRMDALVRQAAEYVSVRSNDLGFFHKSKRKTHASRLASHFRYCQPNECSPSHTRASDGGDVLYSKLNMDTGWLKVTKFPGAVGVEIANQISEAIRELSGCKRLILDLRGNESGGLAFVRVASYLTPQRRTIGFSVTRRGAETGSLEGLKTFGWIPRQKPGLLWLLAKYGFSDPSVRVQTEGLGEFPFHGKTVVLIDEATTGAGERIAAFAAEEHLAPLVGTRTAGQVICSDSKAVGDDFFVRIPSRAWYTPSKQLVEGTGVEPTVRVLQGNGPTADAQLDRAIEIASAL